MMPPPPNASHLHSGEGGGHGSHHPFHGQVLTQVMEAGKEGVFSTVEGAGHLCQSGLARRVLRHAILYTGKLAKIQITKFQKLGLRDQTSEDTYTRIRRDSRITAARGKTKYCTNLSIFYQY
jgi:hypothetical protein